MAMDAATSVGMFPQMRIVYVQGNLPAPTWLLNSQQLCLYYSGTAGANTTLAQVYTMAARVNKA